MGYQIHSMHERPDLRKAFKEIDDSVWPEFMDWDDTQEETKDVSFPEYHFVVTGDGIPAGNISSIPFCLDRPVDDLPEEGWDWMLKKGTNDKISGIEPDTLGGLQVAILDSHQGKSLSSLMVREMKNIALNKGFSRLIIPVRPTLKSEYPHESMSRYILRKREDGLPFDPWLRVHVRLGGRIIKPCNCAMYLHNSVSEWERCTGTTFSQSGNYIVKGALSPVNINLEKDEGIYIEPNVWVVHEIIV